MKLSKKKTIFLQIKIDLLRSDLGCNRCRRS